jgi:hypothetical protein
VKITARFPGTCKACGGPIEIGEEIEWWRGSRPRHVRCPERRSALIDADGQPGPAVNRARRIQRTVTELLGLCKGVLLDGVVTESEMVALDEWLAAHEELAQEWPADVLYERLRRIFDDGVVEEEERAHFKELLEQCVGPAEGARLVDAATRLPLDQPPPEIVFGEHTFCFTGKFVWGPRPRLMQAVEQRGGTSHQVPRKDTDYLVVGTMLSRDWAQPSFGRKIQKVVAGRVKGWKTKIVGEGYWVEALGH